jgi:PAS domain S-box-containing protein
MDNHDVQITGMAFRCRADAALTFEYADGNSRQVTGYNEADLVDTGQINLPDLIQPSFRNEVRRHIQEGLSKRGTFALQAPLFLKSKIPADGILIGKGIFESPLNLTGIEGYLLRLQSGENLITAGKQQHIPADLWQELLAHSDRVIAYLGPDSAIRYISPQISQILGYRVQALLGIPFSDIISPDEKELFFSIFDRTRLQGGEGSDIQLMVKNAEGSLVRLQLRLFVPENPDGSLILTATSCDKKKPEGMQTGSDGREDFIRKISESSPVPLIITEGIDHTIIAANDLFSHLIGYESPDEIIGVNFLDSNIIQIEDVLESLASGSELPSHGIEVSVRTLTKTVPALLSIRSPDAGMLIWSLVPLPEQRNEQESPTGALNQTDLMNRYLQHESELSAIETLVKGRDNLLFLFACSSFYKKIIESSETDTVPVCDYLHTLVNRFSEVYSDTLGRVNINLICNGAWEVNNGVGIPLGIMVTELILNSITHAFVPDRPGSIEISFTREEGWYILQVADTGEGFPGGIIQGELQSTGLLMVDTLASRLSGTATFTNEPGARVRIIFPHP